MTERQATKSAVETTRFIKNEMESGKNCNRNSILTISPRRANTYSGNPKANSDYLPQQKKILLQTIASEHYNVINRFWEATPTPIAEAGVNILAKFILDTDNLDDVLTELEKFAHRYWSKQK